MRDIKYICGKNEAITEDSDGYAIHQHLELDTIISGINHKS